MIRKHSYGGGRVLFLLILNINWSPTTEWFHFVDLCITQLFTYFSFYVFQIMVNILSIVLYFHFRQFFFFLYYCHYFLARSFFFGWSYCTYNLHIYGLEENSNKYVHVSISWSIHFGSIERCFFALSSCLQFSGIFSQLEDESSSCIDSLVS